MKLPEPAATIWRKHREAIRRAATGRDGPCETMLGGGTTMAARLGHRGSTDIDVFAPDLPNTENAERGGSYDLASATGGERRIENGREVKVGLPEGEIDLLAIRPRFRGSEETVVIEGEEVKALSNAQILRGKLERTTRPITRDAYDLWIAARLDPEALEVAVNSLNPKSLNAVEADLRRHRREYANDVRNGSVLTGVPERLKPDAETLGDDAATAVREHVYRGVTIEVGLDRVEIPTERNGRATSRIATTAGELGPTLERTGLKDHLRAVHGVNAERLVDGIQDAVRAGWTGTAIHMEWKPPDDTIGAMEQGTGGKKPTPEGRPPLRPADPSTIAIGGNPAAANVVRPGPLPPPARKLDQSDETHDQAGTAGGVRH